MYERERDPIPAGLHLDHLCRVRDCVNPEHLEPVTNAENLRRGDGTKLTDEDVAAIRASTETNGVLGRRYHVTTDYIRRLRTREKRP
jgi:hypothetical protein